MKVYQIPVSRFCKCLWKQLAMSSNCAIKTASHTREKQCVCAAWPPMSTDVGKRLNFSQNYKTSSRTIFTFSKIQTTTIQKINHFDLLLKQIKNEGILIPKSVDVTLFLYLHYFYCNIKSGICCTIPVSTHDSYLFAGGQTLLLTICISSMLQS